MYAQCHSTSHNEALQIGSVVPVCAKPVAALHVSAHLKLDWPTCLVAVCPGPAAVLCMCC